MPDDLDTTILNAFQGAQKVCAEVLAAATVLEASFQSTLPQDLTVVASERHRGTGGGGQLFDVYSCQFTVGKKTAKSSTLGWATYIFDLGNLDRYAAIKRMPLVVVAWAASRSEPYGYDDLIELSSHHKVFAQRLMRWVVPGEKAPRDDSERRAWLYSVPLTKLHSEDDLIRLLISPLVSLATTQALTRTAVESAFRDAREVLVEGT